MAIVGIKLRNSYSISYVEQNNLYVNKNATCVVETEHGTDIGTVIKCRRYAHCAPGDVRGKLVRTANDADLVRIGEIEAVEKRAFDVCKAKVAEKKLEMKLVSVKCLFDKTKIIFYFVADNRIDFRELVRELASIFRTRIEMRQIGVRDEARLVNGFGPCGRELCCCHFKEEFDPVSIKMAKEQNLNLNSLKISGMCGRLLCCLGYEHEVYQELNKDLPKPDTEIIVSGKKYIVISVEALKHSVRVSCEGQSFNLSGFDLIRLPEGKYTFSEDALRRIKDTLESEDDDIYNLH